MVVHHSAALAVIAVALAVSSSARAEPPWAIGLDYTVAKGGAFESWDLGWRLEAGPMFRIGRWQATASISGTLEIDSKQPLRDSERLSSLGLGGRIAYHFRIDKHGSLLVALGFERLWVEGSAEVRRECRQTGACLAGFYPEFPDYDAWVPQLRVGIGPYADLRDMIVGGTFEVIVEPIHFRDVPPDGLFDIALYGALTFSIGGGPKAKR